MAGTDRTVVGSGIAILLATALAASADVLKAAQLPGTTPESISAQQILDATGVRGGLVVHLGSGDGKLTAALRADDRYLVHALDADAENVRTARRHLQSLGLYGPVSVHQFDGERLPYVDNLVNLIVAEDPGRVTTAELMRVLSPNGVAYVKENGRWTKSVKPRPPSIDEWTHWLHGADGNAVAADEVAGPPRGLQWIAKPLWSRHHNTVPSVSSFVSARGRVFYIVDEAPAGMHGDAPDQWALVGRDAFNGVLLWRIPLADWGWKAWSADWQCRFTTPTHVARRLVATGDHVYATLGFNAPLSEIDAAIGEVLRVFQGTELTDEILYHDGLLILSINKAPQKPGRQADQRRGNGDEPPIRKWVAAVDAQTGKTLWKKGDYVGLRSKTGSMERISHLTLAAGGNRIFFLDQDRIVSLDLRSGQQTWQAPRPEVPEHKMRYSIRITDMCSLVYHDGILLFAQLDPDRRIDWRQVRGKVHAFSAETGEELWSRPCASWGWGHPADVFAVHGLVWVHDFETPHLLGLDPSTGEVRRKTSNHDAFDNGHHHRCYRNKATSRYVMTSYRGLEFIPWEDDKTQLNHWVRGTCRLGAFPSNGMVYSTPHPCDCYISAKLNGLLALTPASADRGQQPTAPRLVRGPAYKQIINHQSSIINPTDWPTYRHDPRRSAIAPTPVAAELQPMWHRRVDGTPSACTIAEGKVFVASVTTHEVCAFNATEGQPIWRFMAGGPVDTPPTIVKGKAIFGCTDGYVYCLRASDGQLAWRFRAAPRDGRVGAFGHLESVWPVHGAVLADNEQVFFVAGRSSFLDGGIHAYCLDARTGNVVAEKVIRTSHTMPVDEGRDQSKDYGALTDVLVGTGDAVYMRGLRLFGPPEGSQSAPRLQSTAGLLDDSWFNRTHWLVDGKPHGELLIGDDRTVVGVKAYATFNANAGFFRPGTGGYELFARDRRPASAGRPEKEDKTAPKGKRASPPTWSIRVPVRITGMVLAGPTLFTAGTPDVLDPKDPWAAHEGRRGGALLAFSAADGNKLAEYRLDAAPVFDGLAAAEGRLYVALADGSIVCFAGRPVE